VVEHQVLISLHVLRKGLLTFDAGGGSATTAVSEDPDEGVGVSAARPSKVANAMGGANASASTPKPHAHGLDKARRGSSVYAPPDYNAMPLKVLDFGGGSAVSGIGSKAKPAAVLGRSPAVRIASIPNDVLLALIMIISCYSLRRASL
jgi:hypothetical protein